MKKFFRKIQSQNFAIFDIFFLNWLQDFLRGWLLVLGLKEGLAGRMCDSVR